MTNMTVREGRLDILQTGSLLIRIKFAKKWPTQVGLTQLERVHTLLVLSVSIESTLQRRWVTLQLSFQFRLAFITSSPCASDLLSNILPRRSP
jgi:hypothetical protein